MNFIPILKISFLSKIEKKMLRKFGFNSGATGYKSAEKRTYTLNFCKIDSRPNTFALCTFLQLDWKYLFILKSLTRLCETSLQEECFPLRDFSHHPSRPLTRFSEDIVVYRGESFSVHRVPLYMRISKNTPL